MVDVILFQTFFTDIWEIYYWNFKRFIKNVLTRSIFEQEKLSFLNGSKFCQKLIGTIIRVPVRHLCPSPASNNDKDPYKVKCHIRAQYAPLEILKMDWSPPKKLNMVCAAHRNEPPPLSGCFWHLPLPLVHATAPHHTVRCILDYLSTGYIIWQVSIS